MFVTYIVGDERKLQIGVSLLAFGPKDLKISYSEKKSEENSALLKYVSKGQNVLETFKICS